MVVALALLTPAFAEVPRPSPSIVFVLLDTTRADRLGAWHPGLATSPSLDALAARGVRFEWHFANSHATRPSMPQLMSGRYYRQNVLAAFQVDANPREMSFAVPDATAPLLPAVLRSHGYQAVGVSAHTWVAPESDLGRSFDRLELLPFAKGQAHGDAEPLVDRALRLWAARDRSRPALLYVHFMDAHIPRRLPEGAPDHPVPGFDWKARFRPGGEPSFGTARRAWSRYDARDFTVDDRRHYAAVYDTALRRMDTALGRLFAVIERDDPGLANTLVVVTADHGEDLAEDGRIEHGDALGDGVQHVPLILAGAGLSPGRCPRATEHVDVVPTVLGALGLSPAPGQSIDGTAWIGDRRLRASCGSPAAYYAWEDYRAVRRGRYLFIERRTDTTAGRCDGRSGLFRVEHDRLTPAEAPARARRLGAMLAARLDQRERTYVARRWGTPTAPFLLRAETWDVAPAASSPCVPIDQDTPQEAIVANSSSWTGRGLAMIDPAGPPLSLAVTVPAGSYRVEVGANPVAQPPWIFGRLRWRKRSFRSIEPTEFIGLGTFDAPAGRLEVPLAPRTLARRHLLALRLSPPSSATPTAVPGAVDPAQRERLRALGYVE